MRYAIAAFVAFMLLASFLVPSADAVGIKWSTEKEMVAELMPHCITYGVYNPSSEDAVVKLSVSEELEPVVQGAVSHTELVKAGTTHDEAVMLELCFQVPKVYEADCLAGDFLCEQTCTQDEVSYTGEIMAVEVNDESGGGMGSATTVGASVPLTLRVRCNPYNRNWTPVYAVVVLVAAAGIGGRVYMKKKK
jgi:hypothetical protein